MTSKILVGSGWWCTEDSENTRTNTKGDKLNRSKEFFELWIKSVKLQGVDFDSVIVDSCSPIKPNKKLLEANSVKLMSLNENGGHAIDHRGHFCGWTRSLIMSMTYCLNGDYDYYIYVEQDALMSPGVFRQAIIDAGIKGVSLGYSSQTAYPLQVSLIVIRQDKIMSILKGLYSISKTDGGFAPENKLALAMSYYGSIPILNKIFNISDSVNSRVFRYILPNFMRKFNYLSFGQGRERPLDFNSSLLYFQQGQLDEINKYKEMYLNEK